MKQKPKDTTEGARQLAVISAAFMDRLIADGWHEGAVLVGVHSAVTARIASTLGAEFAAAASEQAAKELRGVFNG